MTRSRAAASVLCAMLAAATMAPGVAAGRVPDANEEIRRELRIGADVLRAALAEALPESRRVLDVDAGFLADQGVLVLVDVASPWFRLNPRGVDRDSEITSLEQIPDMVQEILSDLNIGLSRHQTEELTELRDIRDRQRAVRAEQRALRADIRGKRRQLLDADESTAAALEAQIDALEKDLAAADEDERILNADAAAARERLMVPPQAEGTAQPAVDLDQAVAGSVCAYGATFKSLDGGQRLNVLVRQPRESRYYVFQMARVRACQAGEITAEELLAESFAYDGEP